MPMTNADDFNKKIKSALSETIIALKKAEAEVEKGYSKLQEKYGQDTDELYDASETDEEFNKLLGHQMSLETEMIELMIQTKFYPLCGLTGNQMEALKGYGEEPEFANVLVMATGKTEDRLWNDSFIEDYLKLQLVKNQEDMKRRLGLLTTLKLGFELAPCIRHLYQQMTMLFVYGFFEATAAMARAVGEAAEKEVILRCGAADQLGNKKKDSSKKEPWEVLLNLGVSQEILDIKRYKIAREASRALHSKGKVLEASALEIIEATKSFLEKLFQAFASLKSKK